MRYDKLRYSTLYLYCIQSQRDELLSLARSQMVLIKQQAAHIVRLQDRLKMQMRQQGIDEETCLTVQLALE